MRNVMMIVISVGVLILILINVKILAKETLLEEGDVVYLELAPVDPRSLMQGDYMALRFHAGNQIRSTLRKQQTSEKGHRSLKSQDGTITVKLDERSVGTFARLTHQQPLAKDEHLIKFRIRDGRVKFATNAYFFQEGTAKDYQQAKYGEFRVTPDGDLLLKSLRDKDLNRMGPKRG